MSHYDEVLEEARSQATSSAKEYIPRLYDILVNEEHKTAEDARNIIEHDLLDYWSKATVTKHLPQEVKDEEKVKAGKQGAAATNLILAGGQSVTMNSDGSGSVSPKGNDNKKKDNALVIENQFLKDENRELKEAMDKLQQFTQATKLEKPKTETSDLSVTLKEKADGVHAFYYDAYGIDLFKNRELSQLKNSGVKVFKRLYFEV